MYCKEVLNFGLSQTRICGSALSLYSVYTVSSNVKRDDLAKAFVE